MSKLLQDSAFFCLAISLIGYEIGIILRQKTKLALCNPLLISIVFVIIILKVTNIKYEVYEDGSSLLSYLLTPSTVCLAIPLHVIHFLHPVYMTTVPLIYCFHIPGIYSGFSEKYSSNDA